MYSEVQGKGIRRIILLSFFCIFLLIGCGNTSKQYEKAEVLEILQEYYAPSYVKEEEVADIFIEGDKDVDIEDMATYVVYNEYDEESSKMEELEYGLKVNLKSGDVEVLYSNGEQKETYNLQAIIAALEGKMKAKETEDDQQGVDEKYTNTDNSKEDVQNIDYKFNSNFITGYGFDILLKEDGSVLTRGENTNGELGNGTLQNSEDWQKVEGIDHVKQIAFSLNLWDEEIGASIYALKEDGTVWTWGAEKVVPEQISDISNIDTLIQKYRGSYGGYGEDYGYVYVYLIDKNGFLQGSLSEGKHHESDFGEIKVNDVTWYGYTTGQEIYLKDELIEGYTVYDMDDQESSLGENIKMCGQADDEHPYFISEEGNLYRYSYDDNIFEQTGKGIAESYCARNEGQEQDYFNFTLFQSGKVYTTGDNNYGELGNGTTDEYSEWWTVDIPAIISIFTPYNGSAYAIDEDNNLWAWGKGYDTLPQILYNLNDVANEN